MPDYLSESEWKKVLKRPENDKVKKTGISDALKNYAKAVSTRDTGRQTACIDEIITKARAVKRTRGFNSDLVNYLDSMAEQAEKALVVLEGARDNDGGNPGMQSLLTVAKTRDAGSPMYFVMAPGKPKSGLVISRKSPNQEMRQVASNQRGRPGLILEGAVYSESGKYVFELPDAPPAGLAKAIRKAVLEDAKRNIRVLVRGGGQNVDDESDAEVDFEPLAESATKPRVASFVRLVDQVHGLPPDQHSKAMEKIAGLARELMEEIRVDAALDATSKQELAKTVRESALKARQALTGNVAAATAVNPDKVKFETAYDGHRRLFAQAVKVDRKVAGQDPLKLAFARSVKTVHAARDQADYRAAYACLPASAKAANALIEASLAGKAHETRHTTMGQTFDAVQKNYFSKGSARQFAQEDLKVGDHFKAVLLALAKVENSKDKGSLDALEQACKAYLAHVQTDLSASQKGSKEAVRKQQIAQTLLIQVRHWRLAEEYKSLPAPSPTWDRKTEMHMAAIQSKLIFEEGNQVGRSESQGVSGSWWVENIDWAQPTIDPQTGLATSEKTKKQYLFKAAKTEAFVQGFPHGGSADREVLGKALADHLRKVSGIDPGVPETQMVSIANELLPVPDLFSENPKPPAPNPEFTGQELCGSIQHFERSDGELQQLMYATGNETLVDRIPAESTHAVAVLDIVALNMDRHSGNFLVTNANDPVKPPGLIPIDQGLVLPSRQGFNERRAKMGISHNAILKLNGRDAKLSPEMVEKLDLVDPEETIAAMKESLSAMKDLHPDVAHDAMVPDENFQMTRRSAQFLKAAATELTVAEIFNAMMVDAELIFDAKDSELQNKFGDAIRRAKARGGPLRRYRALDSKAKQKMCDELKGLGYCLAGLDKEVERWIEFNADKAFVVHEARTPNPAAQAEIDRLLNLLQKTGPATRLKIAGMAPNAAYWQVSQAVAAEARERTREFDASPNPTAEEANRVEIVQLSRNGAWAAYRRFMQQSNHDAPADPTQGTSGDLRLNLEKLRQWHEYQQLGGDAELFKYPVDGEAWELTSRITYLRNFKAEAAELAQM